ncbi:MAG TPA: phosphoglycerate dehydrogenase, partial [Anaerolineales bacterium]|nr:phosphoglycerate dehydrogenase [Anaerolineales bacterium]
DGTICGDDSYSAEVLEAAAPRLKVISKWGTGIDSIDSEAAKRLGIQVRNTPGAFTQAVADTVLGYVLAFARGVPWMDRSVKAGEWNKHPGTSLAECTLGVVGVGRIGRAVLERAAAFGMTLLGNDIVRVELGDLPARLTGLNELLAASDFVSLNCDLNASSRHLINDRTLAQMRSGAVLINTARGSVVDEVALSEALRSGKLAGAALDVFEEEPLPATSPLRGMDNVLLAPHNSNASPSAWERVHWNTIGNLFEGLGLARPQVKPEEQVAAVRR